MPVRAVAIATEEERDEQGKSCPDRGAGAQGAEVGIHGIRRGDADGQTERRQQEQSADHDEHTGPDRRPRTGACLTNHPMAVVRSTITSRSEPWLAPSDGTTAHGAIAVPVACDATLAATAPMNAKRTLADHRTGDAITGITGRLAAVVVGSRVDDESGAVGVTQRSLASGEGHVRIEHVRP